MKRQLFILFLFTLYSSLFTLFPASAATITLPATGQTKCYDPSGTVINCVNTGQGAGQDGGKKMGLSWDDATRFTNNGNGTITDNLTGLIWLQNANCTDSVGGIPGGSLTWDYALTWSNNLASGPCGLSDGSSAGQWRLPTRKELKSLINRGQANSATWLGTLGFSNVRATNYWSSSTYANGTDSAWIVDMSQGDVFSIGKVDFDYVWPVRGGQ